MKDETLQKLKAVCESFKENGEDGWSVSDEEWATHIVHEDGLIIWVREEDGRLSFAPVGKNLGRGYYMHWEENPITVSANRSPESIAADLMRRLLPDAREFHENLIAWEKQIRCMMDKRDSAKKALLALPDAYEGVVGEVVHGPGWSAHVNVGTVDMKLSGLTVDQAVRIVEMINE